MHTSTSNATSTHSNTECADDPPAREPTLFDQPEERDEYAPIFSIRLVREGSFELPTVQSPDEIAPVASAYLSGDHGRDREHLIVVLLAASCRIIGINTAHVGSLTASIVSPREVFKPAILGNASQIIVAHNHPSGNLEPSRADIKMTKKLKAAGKALDIPLADSLIIGFDGEYTSLAQRGVI